ncbi:MAG: MFS transporter [Paraglaciecola sp.]|uniref:MFS transporter n=1 Tax=Paraglaciecola sp. TaxID=1920173 RepID=UPI003296BC8F
MQAQHDSQQPLSFKEKLGYGLGDMASNFYLGFFGLYLLYYFTDIYGLAPAAVALMLLISKIIDAVSDPLMGAIADRTETKWGKYRPYLLWGALPYGLLGFAIFFGPNFSDTGKLIYAYVTYIGVMLAFTVINVPYSALLAVISPSSEERTKATTYRLVCAGIGTLLIAAFATPLAKFLGDGDDVIGFRLTMAIFAIASVLIFWFTYATTKERIRLPKHESSILKDISVLLKNTSWIMLACACILVVIGLIARFSSIIYYVKYYMKDSGEAVFWIFDRVAVFTSFGIIGQIIGAMIASSLVIYFSKHRIVLFMCLLHSVLLIIGYFVPPEMYSLTVLLHFFGIGTFGVIITLFFSMFTDCAEYGEWLTGKRTSGLTVSASMFALKFGSALGGALPGFILAYVGFVANAEQSLETVTGLRLMATALPAVLFTIGGLMMLFYKLDKEFVAKIENDLKYRRQNA